MVLSDYSEITVIRLFLPRKQKQELLPSGEDSSTQVRVSSQVRVERSTAIEPGSQTFVQCTFKHSGLVVIQTHDPLYEKQNLVATNSIIQVEVNRPFKLHIANFCKHTVRFHRHQVIAGVVTAPHGCDRRSFHRR